MTDHYTRPGLLRASTSFVILWGLIGGSQVPRLESPTKTSPALILRPSDRT